MMNISDLIYFTFIDTGEEEGDVSGLGEGGGGRA